MELQHIWILRGANVWARCPVMEVELVLANHVTVAEHRLAACTARLRSWLPSLGRAGSVSDGTTPVAYASGSSNLPALLRDVTLELQRLAGSPVEVGRVRPGGDGFFRVIIEYEEEELGPCLPGDGAAALPGRAGRACHRRRRRTGTSARGGQRCAARSQHGRHRSCRAVSAAFRCAASTAAVSSNSATVPAAPHLHRRDRRHQRHRRDDRPGQAVDALAAATPSACRCPRAGPSPTRTMPGTRPRRLACRSSSSRSTAITAAASPPT